MVSRWRFRGDRATMPGQPRPGFVASLTAVGGDFALSAFADGPQFTATSECST